jgi:hypothetical protein
VTVRTTHHWSIPASVGYGTLQLSHEEAYDLGTRRVHLRIEAERDTFSLTQEQARSLAEVLQRFVATGTIKP